MAKDFDSILSDVGNYGKFQVLMVYFVIVPTSFCVGVQVICIIFMTQVPDHWCDVPGIQNSSMTPEQWKNFTIPWDESESKFSSCTQFEVSWQEGGPVRSNGTRECQAWAYDRSLMTETLATTNDWVCEKEMYSVHVFSLKTVGYAMSTMILPILADRYTGRRPMFFIAITIHLVFSFLVIVTHNFFLHMAFQFLGAWAFQTNYQTSYMIGLEFLSPQKRNWAEFVSFVAWAFGACFVSVLCWGLGDWRYITAVLIALDVVMWGYWWILPESPRWLLTKNRVDDAYQIMLRVARVNNTEDRIDKAVLLKDLQAVENPAENEVSIITMMKYPKFCFRAIVLCLTSAAGFLAVGIVALNINVLPNRYFLNHFILSLVELPSNMSSGVCVQYLGRRFTAIVSYLLCVVISILAIILVDNKIALLVIAGALKWILVMGMYVIYLQVTEIFPTTLRSSGMGFLAVFGLAAFSTVPYIINADTYASFMYWVILVMSILCSLCAFAIPETLGLPLPQTLPEANNLGHNRPLLKWVNHWNLKQYMPDGVMGGDKDETKKMLSGEKESAVLT